MALETATYISDLNASNPPGADPLSQADDHLRLIKSTVKATFPNVTNAVTATHTQLNKAGFDQIQPILATVAANALTITISPVSIDFRSATIGSGTVTRVTSTSSVTVVVSSGSTLGTVNAIAARLAVLAINNAGTIEAAVVNLAGGNNLDETGVITTVAEGGAGAADSANVIYSTTARTGVAYRVVGFIDITEATAGTWATAPSTIQGQGGEALAAMSSVGYGQTWQDMSGSRSSATTYYNQTGKPIFISLYNGAGGTAVDVTLTISGLVVARSNFNGASGGVTNVQSIVPPGASYSAVFTGGTVAWFELR